MNRAKFMKLFFAEYKWLLKHNKELLDNMLPGKAYKPRGCWTKERCKEDSSKHNTRNEWQIASPVPHAIARKNNWFEECCKHMAPSRQMNSHRKIEDAKKDALKYNSKAEWRNGYESLYGRAIKKGWVKECCKHMVSPRKDKGYWTLETCKESALKYKTATEWYKKESGGYTAARNNKWTKECCKHMVKRNYDK